MMKKIFYYVLFSLVLSCNQQKDSKAPAYTKPEVSAIDRVLNIVRNRQQQAVQENQRLDSLAKFKAPLQQLRSQFSQARQAYKRNEIIIAHYFPENTKRINGAAIPYNEVYDNLKKVIEPTGFQVIEEILWAEKLDYSELQKQTQVLATLSSALHNKLMYLQINETTFFEALRLEILRIIALGISGFDSPVALLSLPEARAALEGVEELAFVYANKNEMQQLQTSISNASNFLAKAQDFNAFDRFTFIKTYCTPISKQLFQLQKRNNISVSTLPKPIDFAAPTFNQLDTFNTLYFAPPRSREATEAEIALGKDLFSDPILSGNGSVSCATCHIPSEGYADHKKRVFPKNGMEVNRNTPSLLLAAYQNSYFQDSRIPFLEDQAKHVINNQDEMHGSFEDAVARLQRNTTYTEKFTSNFEDGITERNLLHVLASFTRSLPAFTSKFDQSLRNEASLTAEEQLGFNVFMGKGKCATCHFYPLFNGSVPPLYQETESEVLGVPRVADTTNARVDPDKGVYYVFEAPLKEFAFKTPTVRNTAITFPYMHNGVYQTLEEVIDFYNRGGGAGIGIELDHQTLPPDPLNLTDPEQKALIAFIHTLNEEQKESARQTVATANN